MSILKQRDILSMREIGPPEIAEVLERAAQMKQNQLKSDSTLLQGTLLASCFFEPSTRTRLSFEAAMHRLGGDVMGFADALSTATQKGESLQDTMRVIGGYSDLIVIRHPLAGSARVAAEASHAPVINGGDGANEHPTQTLLDLFTIQECQQRLEGLIIGFVGDLLYGRTVHSLALSLCHFKSRLYFVSPPALALPEPICQELHHAGIAFSVHQTLEEIMDKIDILYMTRIQKERFSRPEEYQKCVDQYILTPPLLERARSHLRVLHPLPRVNEIHPSVDATPYAAYFQQAENGLYVRAALLALLLGK